MKIAFAPIYGNTYLEDRLFIASSCKIGENLLMPDIIFKRKMEGLGHEVHTIDMYHEGEADIILFCDIPNDSMVTIRNPIDLGKYLIKKKWNTDFFRSAIKHYSKENIFLRINEPPSVWSCSYNKKFHKYFNRILTWNDSLVDRQKYFKCCIPQYFPEKYNWKSFSEKSFSTMIVANKVSRYPNELYSARKSIIEFFEKKPNSLFDLYGIGWEKCNYKNYKGVVEKKLDTLSNYKFCYCYENVKDIPGYITEKIFDCFFAGTVPIYLGANNITAYVPEDIFIDARRFSSHAEILEYILSITEEEYETTRAKTFDYLHSDLFYSNFSVDVCAQILENFLLGKI